MRDNKEIVGFSDLSTSLQVLVIFAWIGIIFGVLMFILGMLAAVAGV